MSTFYTTRQGETVDLVCQAFYGRTADVTEAVLNANPGLAALGPVLPMTTQITMPVIATKPKARALIKLYE
jgi:phage tail protein X